MADCFPRAEAFRLLGAISKIASIHVWHVYRILQKVSQKGSNKEFNVKSQKTRKSVVVSCHST
jgi:hypothetical protein